MSCLKGSLSQKECQTEKPGTGLFAPKTTPCNNISLLKNTTVKFKNSILCIKMEVNRGGVVVGDGGAVFQCTQPVKYIPFYLGQKASCNRRVATPGILLHKSIGDRPVR